GIAPGPQEPYSLEARLYRLVRLIASSVPNVRRGRKNTSHPDSTRGRRNGGLARRLQKTDKKDRVDQMQRRWRRNPGRFDSRAGLRTEKQVTLILGKSIFFETATAGFSTKSEQT